MVQSEICHKLVVLFMMHQCQHTEPYVALENECVVILQILTG